MEENFINKRLESLKPFLRGIMYDGYAELYTRLHVMFPKTWKYKNLLEKGLVWKVETNEKSFMMVIGLDPKKDKDITVDALLIEFEEVIEFNKKEAKKQKLLQKKIKQMQNMSLEDIENLDLPSFMEESVDEDNSYFDIPFVDPMIDMLKRNIPIQPVVSSNEVIFTPLYQNAGPNIIDSPVPLPAKHDYDGFQLNTFDESILYKDGEFVPDDPNDPEKTRQMQAEYYLRQQQKMHQQLKGASFQQPVEDFNPLRREPPESMDGVGFKPMPGLIDNLRDNY